MEVKTLLDLGKLAEICRKKGIAEIKIDEKGLEFKLWDHIPTPSKRTRAKSSSTSSEQIPLENQPTEEEILFWSSSPLGSPEESAN